ncbi:MAG: AAA domain-containing protein [Firmicutes bacterium]|nr:AAA domain-containing protein [Bacillota bacterium]
MKRALLINAVNPAVGGVLIRGEKGTAKSTAVRALVDILPEIEVVADCRFGCHPTDRSMMCDECLARIEAGESIPRGMRKMKVVELPVGATEDRVVGTLDIEQAIKKGEKAFEPGILAQAHRNVLYIDEVNLLDDHVVDVLLDVAAMGVNVVEREGVSYSHPARFVLIGTMNPEEGELRPQLLDRFGLAVDVAGIEDIASRVEVVRRRIRYESDPAGFAEEWAAEQASLKERVVKAKEILPEVNIPESMLELIARIAVEMGVDGHRADITMMKASMTLAALAGKRAVTEEEVRQAADLALLHRTRRRPFEDFKFDSAKVEALIPGKGKQAS